MLLDFWKTSTSPVVNFDLLKDGTDAVFVTARGNGKTRVDAFPVAACGCTVCVSAKDADGKDVASCKAKAEPHTVIKLDVKEPHLWNGLADPYCYTVEAILVKGIDVLESAPVDAVTVTYGYRSFHVDPDTGFWLNGKNMPLREQYAMEFY